jgi:adenine-specific DNA-methyltransferase
MNKLNGKSKDIVADNIEKIKELFPEVFTENKIDFERLQGILGEYIEDKDERYRFEWHGKSKAIRLAQIQSTGTLRACKEESKNWDTTENLYIEGDNLEVIKLLQKTYNNSIKMIYIDPPYNTGKDFVYKDNFRDSIKNYLEITGQTDTEGKKTSTNSYTSGRYHTDWLNMMYPRLKLARNLLTDDGVIYISIDDNEVGNLKKICNEIFGEDNFITAIVWERAFSPINLKNHFSESHDYVLVYSKKIDQVVCNGLKRDDKSLDRYKNPDNDNRGPWTSGDLSVGPIVQEKIYEIITPSGRKVLPPSGYCWRLDKQILNNYISDNRIWFGEHGSNVPRIKRFLSEVKSTITPMTVWKYTDVGHSQSAKQKLKKLFDGKAYFDYPKPVELIQRMIELYTREADIILDFFSGSATAAHANMQLNVEDRKKRKFIMVQLPEQTDEKSEAYKVGYKNICEIGKERIRRAGDKIVENNKDKEGIENLDIGFKVFKLDSSNLKKWNPDYDKLEMSLDDIVSNYVEGRTEEDVLFEIMLKYGIDLTYPIEIENVNGKKIFSIGFGLLFVCLDDEITTEIADFICVKRDELMPKSIVEDEDVRKITRVVFKDNGFIDDSAKTNIIQILKRNGIEEIMSV